LVGVIATISDGVEKIVKIPAHPKYFVGVVVKHNRLFNWFLVEISEIQ
jgi:hypothetical protein